MPESLTQVLAPLNCPLEEVLLDPNNPRFAELGEAVDPVPEHRFNEEKVQRDTLERMKKDRFEVAELRDTIKQLGFLPMDRVVVRKWAGSQSDKSVRYVVVEGNRRITALKWLVELHDAGRETLSAEQLENFKKLEVLLLDDVRAPSSARLILPGLRHVSGIKEWGAYQKARAVIALREAGSASQEVAQSLGLSTREANRLWRSYYALQQMLEDDEYGEFASPALYSYFEEILKQRNVREWLEWSDADRKFKNEARAAEVYGWIVGQPNDEGELGEKKLPEAKSIRELSRILDDPSAMSVFRATDGTLERALARYETERPQEWRPTIQSADVVLRNLSPDTLRGLSPEDLGSLQELKTRIERLMSDRERLIRG